MCEINLTHFAFVHSFSFSGQHSAKTPQLARLQHENLYLKSYAREVEEQFQSERLKSQQLVAELEHKVERTVKTLEDLDKELDGCKAQYLESQCSHAETSRQLHESNEKVAALTIEAEELTRKANDAKAFSAHRQELLARMKEDMQNSLDEAKESENALVEEVSEWMDKATKAESALESSQTLYLRTKCAMDKVAASLDDALQREENLQEKASELHKLNCKLDKQLEEERKQKEKVLEHMCRNMDEMAMAEAEDSQDYTNLLINVFYRERSIHQVALIASHRLHNISAEEERKHMKEEHAQQLQSIAAEARQEYGQLMETHKKMHVEAQEKAENEMSDMANRLQEAKTSLVESRDAHEAYKKSSETIIAIHNGELESASRLNAELIESSAEMKEVIEGLRRAQDELQEANSKLHGELEARCEAYGAVKDQLETLQKEFEAVLDERNSLQRENAKAENEMSDMADQLQKAKTSLVETRDAHEANLKSSETIIAVHKGELESASRLSAELIESSAEMKEVIEGLRRAQDELQEAKNKLHGELEARCEAYGAVKDQLETLQKEFEAVLDERNSLQRENAKAENEMSDMADQLQKAETSLVETRDAHEAYLKSSETIIAVHKGELESASRLNAELIESSAEMKEVIEGLRRAQDELQEANSKLLGELEARCEAYGAVKDQLETLQKEFEAVLDERNSLQRENAKAENEMSDMADQLQKAETSLVETRDAHEAYLKSSETIIAVHKGELESASRLNAELIESNAEMKEVIEGLRRAQDELQEANDKVHSELEGRCEAYGAVKDQLETLQKEFEAVLDERNSLQRENAKAENEMSDMADQLQKAETSLVESRDAYLKSSETITAVHKGELESASRLNAELTKSNAEMKEVIEGLRRAQDELQEANDKFHSELDARWLEAYSVVKGQLETLQMEFQAVLDERDSLKRENAKINSLQNCVVSAISGTTNMFSQGDSNTGCGTVPEELRKQYQQEIESLKEEKRRLAVTAVTEMQKAEQRASVSEMTVAKLKKELRTVKLARNALQLVVQDRQNRGTQADCASLVKSIQLNDMKEVGPELPVAGGKLIKIESTALSPSARKMTLPKVKIPNVECE